MDFLKKFGIYIVFGLIAIAAIVAGLFYPLPGMLAGIKAEVDQRTALNSQLTSLAGGTRMLPDVSLTSADPEPLGMFPTARNYERGVAAVETFGQSADTVINLIDGINAKSLLVQGSLPLELGDTRRNVLLQDFQRTYQRRMNLAGTTFDSSLAADPLNGTFPLDADELERESERVENVLRQRIRFAPNGDPINEDEVLDLIDEQLATLPDRLVARKAQRAKMYISPDAFDISAAMNTADANSVPTNIDVFYAQVSLWVQEDIADALAGANADAENVLDAPVKHLLRIEVDANALGGLENARSNLPPAPSDVDFPTDPATTIEPDFTVSLTGRTSNPFYEVVPFTVRIRVDATKVPDVLGAFSEDRLLGVLNVPSMTVIDSGLAKSQSFLYGEAPVAEIEIEGEALLLRSWLAQYVPKQVKAAITNTEGAPGAGGGSGYGGFDGGGYGGYGEDGAFGGF